MEIDDRPEIPVDIKYELGGDLHLIGIFAELGLERSRGNGRGNDTQIITVVEGTK